jgi:hypothetical protein
VVGMVTINLEALAVSCGVGPPHAGLRASPTCMGVDGTRWSPAQQTLPPTPADQSVCSVAEGSSAGAQLPAVWGPGWRSCQDGGSSPGPNQDHLPR